MKKTLISALAVGLLLGTSPMLRAQGDAAAFKPLAVVSFAGYGELKSDLAFFGQIAQFPELSQLIEGPLMQITQGKGLAGLDPARPWGVVVGLDEKTFAQQQLAFIPVMDVKQLLGALTAVTGPAVDTGNGIFKVQQNFTPVFIKQQGTWAFVSQTPQGLANLPNDPLPLLGGLDKEYDLAIRANVHNIPDAYRGFAVDLIKQGASTSVRPNEGESEEAFKLRTQIMQTQIDAVGQAINELDAITVGWSIDDEGQRAFLDISATLVEGSASALQLANMPKVSSKIAGFLRPDAPLTLHVNSAMAEADKQQAMAAFGTLRAQLMAEIDKDQDLANDPAKELVKELAGQVMDVAEATLEKGHFNLGLALVGEGPYTVCLGGYVAGGSQLEDAVKKLIQATAGQPGAPEVKLNVAEHQGVRFHTTSVPVEAGEALNAEHIKQLIGNPLEVTVGFGPESFFLAIGQRGVDTIKQVIDASATGGSGDSTSPFQMSLALAPFMKLAAQQPNSDPAVKMLADALSQSGKDHIKIDEVIVPNGVRVRIEIEEGILKVLGAAAKTAAQGRPAGNR